MTFSSRLLPVFALLLAVSQAVSAQEYKWYTQFGGGPTFMSDIDATQAGITLTSEFDTGGAIFGAIGAIFGDFRAEAELFGSINDVSAIKAGGNSVSANGDVSTAGLMFNGYFDIPTGSKWKPYIGGGLGFSNVAINDLAAVGFLIADDDDTVFAYQGKAGVAYQFSERWAGMLGYRYFATDDADFVDSGGSGFSTDGVQMHVFEIGARFRW